MFPGEPHEVVHLPLDLGSLLLTPRLLSGSLFLRRTPCLFRLPLQRGALTGFLRSVGGGLGCWRGSG